MPSRKRNAREHTQVLPYIGHFFVHHSYEMFKFLNSSESPTNYTPPVLPAVLIHRISYKQNDGIINVR